jgi:hypothetical protein
VPRAISRGRDGFCAFQVCLVRAGQEQSDRREPLPTEHESLTPEERPSSPSGRLRGSASTAFRAASTSSPTCPKRRPIRLRSRQGRPRRFPSRLSQLLPRCAPMIITRAVSGYLSCAHLLSSDGGWSPCPRAGSRETDVAWGSKGSDGRPHPVSANKQGSPCFQTPWAKPGSYRAGRWCAPTTRTCSNKRGVAGSLFASLGRPDGFTKLT